VPDVTREDLLRKREVLCRTVVEELIEGYRDTVPDIDVHLMPGAPEAAITETAEYLGVDVIVMGTKCRSGLSGFLFGNAAEAILQSVNCGVLVVKPDAFEAQLRVGEDLAA
jgi:nucleotide-binding universal stress UspA family protein